MALSTTTAIYAGGIQSFAVNFALGYIQRSDVQVRVNGAVDGGGGGDPVYTAFTWIDDANILVTPALTIGDSVQLIRTVSKTELKVSFASTTDVTPANLDVSAKHGLMVYQELVDGRVDGAESPVTAADRATIQANAADASAVAALASENAAAAAAATVVGPLIASQNFADVYDAEVAVSNLGITATIAELNLLDGVTATAAELNALDGITATVTELNYTDNVTSPIQTQLNTKSPIASPTFTGVPAAPTATAGTDTTQVATTAFVKDEIPNQLNATGAAPLYGCRAWVNFNGTGVVAIRASGNVSSITDNGTGDYTVNFTTAMADVNYCTVASVDTGGTNVTQGAALTLDLAVGSFRLLTGNSSNGTKLDSAGVHAAIFR